MLRTLFSQQTFPILNTNRIYLQVFCNREIFLEFTSLESRISIPFRFAQPNKN